MLAILQFLILAAAAQVGAAAAAPPASPSPTAPLTQAEAQAAVGEVLPKIEAIRGLTFKAPVPVRVIDDAQARAYARSRFERMTPPAKIRADESAYRLLGLVPPGTDVLKTLLDVLQEQAGGFYDPESKVFYLLDDQPHALTGILTAHEMTHALEDQYYDIDGRLEKVADDDDRTFALSALAEGSASLAMTDYLLEEIRSGRSTPAAIEAARETEAGRAERLDRMPGVLRKELLGPYILGALFLEKGDLARAAAGYPKSLAQAAWKNPPRSSEQILHPEKYWDPDRRDEPKRVTLPDASTILRGSWRKVGEGVLGEIAIGGLVGAPAPGSQDAAAMTDASLWTNDAAAGWGGDRWELWTSGSSAVVLLKTVWDSSADAREFAEGLSRARVALASKREGDTVAVVAGAAGKAQGKLLDLLAGGEAGR